MHVYGLCRDWKAFVCSSWHTLLVGRFTLKHSLRLNHFQCPHVTHTHHITSCMHARTHTQMRCDIATCTHLVYLLPFPWWYIKQPNIIEGFPIVIKSTTYNHLWKFTTKINTACSMIRPWFRPRFTFIRLNLWPAL